MRDKNPTVKKTLPKRQNSPSSNRKNSLTLEILGIGIEVQYYDKKVRQLLFDSYSAFLSNGPIPILLRYCIRGDAGGRGYRLNTFELRSGNAHTESELLYNLEKDIELSLQRSHAHWYFIHAASLSLDGKCCLLIAPSGTGKSTTTWALVNHGFCYLSDELAPVDLTAMRVSSYPYALGLKSRPPEPYRLPRETVFTHPIFHVPVRCLPGGFQSRSSPLTAIFFIEFKPELSRPSLSAVSPSEAAARIYANTLNQLAHPNKGLAAAVRIAQHVNAYHLSTTADLGFAVQLVRGAMAA